MSYPFPGNVRELKKILMRALIESEGQEIQPEHLFLFHTPDPIPATTPGSPAATIDLPLNLQQAEAIIIKRAISHAGGNMAQTARLLGINRTKLYRMLQQLKMRLKP